MPGSYIVAGARTPIGKMSGALASFSAAELGGFAIKAALERAGISPEQVEHVLMGQVLMAGQGQVPSRQAAAKAGIPLSVPAVNVNKVCLSRPEHDLPRRPDDRRPVRPTSSSPAAWSSMTNAPYLLPGARAGFRYGNTELEGRDHRRRPVVLVRRLPDGSRHRELHGRLDHPRAAGRDRGEEQRAGGERDQGRPLRRRDRPGRASRSARASRSWSRPTRACAPAPRWSRWPGSSRRSTRTARSPRPTPRRSATVARPS